MRNAPRSRDELLTRIIDIEWDMMQRVIAAEPNLCQQRPETFRAMRGMSHSVLSDETLRSYFNDLEGALEAGRNLITEKYARMDNLILPLSDSPLIPKIVKIEMDWIQQLNDRFPLTFKGRFASFENYLSCELETFSDQTIELYYRDVFSAAEAGKNLTEQRYLNLFEKMGYGSIEEVEKKAKDSSQA